MSLNFADPADLDPDQRENGTVFAPRFDAQGLIPVVTVAAEGHDVLMLAHMNAEALALTLTTGIAHYWSRSRQSLWKKGETSGETQHVVEMRTDCDQDCIVMSVRQAGRGAACHTGRQSCFYRRVDIKTGTARLVDAGVPQIFDPASVYKS